MVTVAAQYHEPVFQSSSELPQTPLTVFSRSPQQPRNSVLGTLRISILDLNLGDLTGDPSPTLLRDTQTLTKDFSIRRRGHQTSLLNSFHPRTLTPAQFSRPYRRAVHDCPTLGGRQLHILVTPKWPFRNTFPALGRSLGCASVTRSHVYARAGKENPKSNRPLVASVMKCACVGVS